MINGYTDRNWEISQYHSNDRYNFPKLQMKEFKRTLNNFKEKIITFFQTSSGSNFGLFLRKLYRIILNLEYELTTMSKNGEWIRCQYAAGNIVKILWFPELGKWPSSTG